MSLGLISVSFRQLSIEEIIAFCEMNTIEYIEWGGDVHVPVGDIKKAEYVKILSKENDIKISSYGSYFDFEKPINFLDVLNTAKALGAPKIRLWATRHKVLPKDEYQAFIEKAIALKKLASLNGIDLYFEYHRNTLTEDVIQALDIKAKTGIDIAWQPNPELSKTERLDEITKLKPSIIHTFSWTFEEGENIRYPLNKDEWFDYISLIGKDKLYLLEFFKEDNLEQAKKDIEAIKTLLQVKNETRKTKT